ncbi:MAG: C39 family peptidase [Oscillospiraceae bacterium]
MDYFKNDRYNILGGVIIALNVLAIISSTTTQVIETSLGGSIGTSIGYSVVGSSEVVGMSQFSFVDKGKVIKKVKKYTPEPLETFITHDISASVIDVPFIDQTTWYPTGCESVSTTTVLQYYGIDITVDDFIEKHLEKAELKVIGYKKGNERILSSEHPNDAFIGNPKSASGLGCYERTITNAINSVLKEKDLEDFFKVEYHRDLTINDIKNYLDNDVPVIVWATQNMVPSEEGLKWYINGTDTIFQYMRNEHCLVAIGYDKDNIYFNDSLVGRIAYPTDLFLDRYTQMNTRTVTVEYIG